MALQVYFLFLKENDVKEHLVQVVFKKQIFNVICEALCDEEEKNSNISYLRDIMNLFSSLDGSHSKV